MSDAVEPFEIRVDDAVLDDLRDRLARTRWPDQIDGTGWERGTPVDDVRELAAYWSDGYDWRAEERRLNSVDHFRTTIDGQSIHFIHAPSPNTDAVPLLVMHGWPGSVVEFLDAIPLLRDDFHLVVPSLPGYGFSEPPRTPGWDTVRIATAFAELMGRLRYDRYGAQGGDWGAQVATRIGALDPEHCFALHLNMPLATKPKDDVALSQEELADLAEFATWQKGEAGYSLVQGTKPQTLGVGLNDSPAGLLAWIVEKFRAWSDCDGDPLNAFTREALITNVMLYWATGTITSSTRLYWEHLHGGSTQKYVEIPTAVARFPKEPLRFPRPWVERFYNVVRWTEMDKGGHFAAMEQPQLFADDVREFFRELR